MGCGSSKRVDGATVPYRPSPTSFAVFDINAIEEPWLKHLNNPTTPLNLNKPSLPAPILHKLNMLDSTDAPQSWEQVSKTLQDLKPVITKQKPEPEPEPEPKQQPAQPPQKTSSFHTLEELDAKLNPKPKAKPELKPINPEMKKPAEITNKNITSEAVRVNKLKDNMFIVRDRLERQNEEKESTFERLRRDPLSAFPEKCPPGGSDTVVVYTTSLGGVRKTFEDCNRARDVLEGHRVVFDERDVSLHGEFLREVKELMGGGEGVALPRVFVKGRYVGGLEELVELNETGRLGRILNATRVERGIGRQACGACGGARFLPCFECGGSCKLLDKQRCPKCNENGLVHCPACI